MKVINWGYFTKYGFYTMKHMLTIPSTYWLDFSSKYVLSPSAIEILYQLRKTQSPQDNLNLILCVSWIFWRGKFKVISGRIWNYELESSFCINPASRAYLIQMEMYDFGVSYLPTFSTGRNSKQTFYRKIRVHGFSL